ncbi:hypothetical protein CCAX7_23240 [Capsulimonas corticalis]|uniref:Uncharacterized protein n=1 Tax=Capsulimonas corticalis TaxID=2219043 RepID=A0A402CV42_9BACT|nr:hypothetical protein [Capsulimonas corticalis]BDI30273.1 hypothetical protein CCAX7_23240 [Capsulimonas corticalis]
MTLTIEVTPDIEQALAEAARRQGQTLEAAATAALREVFGDMPSHQTQPDATLALFEQWDREDATDDVDELQRRDREWRETEGQLRSSRIRFRNAGELTDGKAA